MSRILKIGLLLALVFGVVWLAVIIWWQESRTLPTGVDIGLYLFALPLALIAAAWGGARILRARREARAAPTQPAQDSAAQTAEPAPKAARLRVLASAASAAMGSEAAAIHAALVAQQRPDLDPSFKNTRGFPVFSARAPQLDTDALRATAREARAPAAALDEERVRATALLAEVAETLSQAARSIVLNQGEPQRDDAWPLLQLELLLPADWPDAVRDHAAGQARAASAWPASRIVERLHAAQGALACDGLLRQLAQESLTARSATLRLVAVADSYIDAARVEEWDAAGRLMSNTNPQGLVPGEAAAGLLLDLAINAPGGEPARADAALSLTLSAQVPRAVDADARGALHEVRLTELATQFLAEHGQPAKGVAALISDADHRGSRPLETAGLASALFPALDPNQDCLAVGSGCGHTGAAAHLLTVAVAGIACVEAGAPVLALMTQDPALRTLVLVSSSEPLPA
ncbi:hypothetical protein [Achromobacter aegrifaciens]